ncbi:CDGSH iron-sulfur domain-containing protein [Planctomonas psychrotolerans]|uniref:CDGSH iron-sulfur domain-containing protein n=1 Tax=Planctomonas psychrotolerans TaxID=2528712 RepID=UPI001239BD1B|nr:CDGSH iron-sulfur domain-containing protein [Planctomonas psychrotolerans]
MSDAVGTGAGDAGARNRTGPGDADQDVVIVAYPDGPFLVRGDVAITAPDGTPVERTRATVALCRCGKSTIKPFCDGTHKLIGFRTEPQLPGDPAA